MYMSLYWYRWTGQSGQAKLGYTTYESGKSTTLHSVFDPAFPETPALVYGLNHLDSTEVKPDLIWQLNPGSLLSPTMLGCNGWPAKNSSDLNYTADIEELNYTLL